MRRLDLTDYGVAIPGVDEPVRYTMRASVVNLLFLPDLKLGAVQLLQQERLARKVLDETGDVVLLEEAEYVALRTAVETFRGFQRADVEFVRRVMEAPTVQVKESD